MRLKSSVSDVTKSFRQRHSLPQLSQLQSPNPSEQASHAPNPTASTSTQNTTTNTVPGATIITQKMFVKKLGLPRERSLKRKNQLAHLRLPAKSAKNAEGKRPISKRSIAEAAIRISQKLNLRIIETM